jgi:putative chitinase
MFEASILKLQKAVGVHADGIIGRGTLSALFRKLGASNARAEELALAANVHMRTYGILDNSLRFIHFMAQLTHESGNFRYMEEIASGKAYEGRKDLGNIHAGDGVRFKGRGPIQLTGRANYRRYGQQLGIDLENNPEIVALPSMGLMVACKFWSDNGLNALADKDDMVAVTRRINGGTNGLEDRKKHLALLRSWV